MKSVRRLLLVGAGGMLAQKVAAATSGGCEVISVDLPGFDLTNRDQVFETVHKFVPEVIINCAAFTDVDGCESQEGLANKVNGTAVGYLAAAALAIDATLVHISTDYVFSGEGTAPLGEDDPVAPQSAYGRSKVLGEQAILTSGLEKYFILRTSWLFGPGGHNFVETIIRLAKEREQFGIVDDQVGSPTYTGDLADAIFTLIALDTLQSPFEAGSLVYGIYHFSNAGACSWYEFAVAIVDRARRNNEPLKVVQISPIQSEDYPLPAKRPAYSLLSKEKYLGLTGKRIPSWQEGLDEYFRERKLSGL